MGRSERIRSTSGRMLRTSRQDVRLESRLLSGRNIYHLHLVTSFRRNCSEISADDTLISYCTYSAHSQTSLRETE